MAISRFSKKHRASMALATALLLALMSGCGTQTAATSGSATPSSKATATTGVPATPAVPPPTAATVKLMTPTGELAGQAILTEMPMGVEIAVTANGLAPGVHGFRIHANGTCSAGPDPTTGKTVPFGAAGEQFVPPASSRLMPATGPAVSSSATPSLTADAAGKATVRYLNPQVTLAKGEASVMGRSLVVYANPTGRVLCGLIVPAQVESVVG